MAPADRSGTGSTVVAPNDGGAGRRQDDAVAVPVTTAAADPWDLLLRETCTRGFLPWTDDILDRVVSEAAEDASSIALKYPADVISSTRNEQDGVIAKMVTTCICSILLYPIMFVAGLLLVFPMSLALRFMVHPTAWIAVATKIPLKATLLVVFVLRHPSAACSLASSWLKDHANRASASLKH